MLALLLWVLQSTAAPAAPAAADQATTPQAEESGVEPYSGSLVAGLAELRERSTERDDERALELADSLLASPAMDELEEPSRARALFDIGVARARAQVTGPAIESFHSASALAGPGSLRLNAAYDAGTALLELAEELRLDVPEVAERLGLPAPSMPPQGPGGPEGEQPDPLEVAKSAYVATRAELIERLRLEWSDEDTRANLELCLRRLRELDEIEREREEQEQEDQEQQDQEQPPDEEPPEDSEEQQQDQEQEQEQDPEDQEQDQEQQQDPEDQESQDSEDESPPEEEPEPEESESDEQQEPPEPQDSEEEQQEETDPESEPEPAREEERVLSKEEVQRLLDQLEEIEEQARQVRARLRERRRKPVEKDW